MIHRIKKYVLDGNPISDGSKKRLFNEGIIENRSLWELLLQQQHGGEPLFDGPLNIRVTFFFSNVLRLKKDRKKELHIVHPPIDDLCKFLFEIMPKNIIKDSRFVCSITTRKVYAPKAYTEIIVEEAIDNG